MSDDALQLLVTDLEDPCLPEGYASACVAVAAQVLLGPGRQVEEHRLQPLLRTLIGWSTSYVHSNRFLASLALFHALERGLVVKECWYLEHLHRFVAEGPTFRKLRETVNMERWVSDAWSSLTCVRRPLDVEVTTAQKHVAGDYWAAPAPPPVEPDELAYQRRPQADVTLQELSVAVVGSLLDNVPNMAGLIRTTESLLGRRAEVTLRDEKILKDPNFLKMSVASERACRVVAVPEGPRLVNYLREKKTDGFVVVALEQTSSSVLLRADVKLPEKIVILVGSEGTGVPVWLVQSGIIDTFLELPLLGRTQSLNAHVTASMLLWHYSLQHC